MALWKAKKTEASTVDYNWFRKTKAYKYAKDVCDNKIVTNVYVKKQCKQILDMVDDENSRFYKKYFISKSIVKRIDVIVEMMNFATGEFAGQPCKEYIAGFQWLILYMCYGVFYREDPRKRRFEKACIFISRKNAKTWICSTFMILALLFEPNYAQTYAAANSRDQAVILYDEIKKTLEMSPLLAKYFKITGGKIECKHNNNTLRPISAEARNLDGKLASVAVVDEFGAAKDTAVMDSLQTSMLATINRLLFTISTAYPYPDNPMKDMIDYGKKILDGMIEDDKFFMLHYALEEKDDWTDEKNWIKANPLQATSKLGMEFLRSECKMAIELPTKRTSFMTKNLNIWLDGDTTEVYISIDDVKKCKIDNYDWEGREVIVGLDLSLTTDNTAVSMTTFDYDLNKYVAKCWGFLPEGNADNKIKVEKIPYNIYRQMEYCYYCGDKVIDYNFVEDFIINLESKYGVKIKCIAYDRYNCMSTATKLDNLGYETIEVRQSSYVLHPGTKLLKECILKENFLYEKNELLEINFSNAREQTDMNLNTFINKKKSTGKIDLVASIINTMVVWHTENIELDVYTSGSRDGFITL